VGGCGIVLGLVLAAMQAGATSPSSGSVRLCVALDGDDASNGLLPFSDGKGNGPLRTPQAALRKLREMRSQDPSMNERDATIEFVPGVWFLDAPLEIGPDDSGGPGHPLRITGTYRQPFVISPEGTVFSGCRRIEGWRAAKVRGIDVMVADVPDVDGRPWRFRELFVGGRRCVRARHPDTGCLAIEGVVPSDAAKPWNEGVASIRFAPKDLTKLDGASPGDLTLMSRWVESHCRIESFDAATGVVTLRDKTVFKPDPGDLGYVESFAALDAPGEWWLDEAEKRVCYLPRRGEDLARDGAVAPVIPCLLRIVGEDAPSRRVHDIELSHLHFEGAEWWYPTSADPAAPRTSGSPQAAIDVPAAIELCNAEDVSIRSCEVARCGTYGIALGRGCKRDVISKTRLHDLGGGGIKIGETAIPPPASETSENVVIWTTIEDVGRVFHSAVGIWIGQSPSNRLQYDVVRGLYYTGISIGWTWGYGAANAGGNVVEWCAIADVGKGAAGDGPLLSDMGGIYTLGTQEGTVLRGNFIGEVAALRYGGWGIYFDEGTTHVEATENVVLHTTHGGFHQHYGRENHVHHNLFAWGRDAQLQRTRPEEHLSFTFDHNVVAGGSGEQFAGDLRDGHFDFHENVYEVDDAARARFAGKTFSDWQAAGLDRGSIVAPVDLEPAMGLGFDRQVRFGRVAPPESPVWMIFESPPVRLFPIGLETLRARGRRD
jgi:hypothetical protein